MGTAPQLGPKYSPLFLFPEKHVMEGFAQVVAMRFKTTKDSVGAANVREKWTLG